MNLNNMKIFAVFLSLLLIFPNMGNSRILDELPDLHGNSIDGGFWRSPDGATKPIIYVINTLNWTGAASDSTRNVEGGGTWPVRQGGEKTLMMEHESSGKKGIFLYEVAGYIQPASPEIFYFNGNDYGASFLYGTAPTPGIIHKGVMIRTKSGTSTLKNNYWSHFRSYLSVEYPVGKAGVWRSFSNASPRQLFEHCEFLFGTDVCFGSGASFPSGEGEVTVWRSIAAYGLNNTDHPWTPDHSKGLAMSEDTWKMDVVQCIFAFNKDRNPYFQRGSKNVYNNLLYDWYWPIHLQDADGPIQTNIIGNLSIAGTDTTDGPHPILLNELVSSTQIYLHDNRAIDGENTYQQSDSSDWSLVKNSSGQSESTLKETSIISSIALTGYTPVAATGVETLLKANAGAFPAYRTTTITNLVNQITNRSGHILDKEEATYPGEWSTGPVALVLPANPHDDSGNGYTNIEMWYKNNYRAPIEGTGGSDTTPPELSGFSPTGTLASSTTSTLVSWLTNEASTCQWNEVGGLPFDDGGMTEATTTGGTQHSFTYSGLEPLDEVIIYIRCKDGSNNANTDDYIGNFNIGPAESLLSNETYSTDSGNFDPDYGVAHLWDNCIDRSSSCTAGKAGETQFWVEADLKALHALTKASIFGDYYGDWHSSTWTMKYKVNSGDSWSTAFSTQACLGNQWYNQSLSSQAQYVRFEVNGPAAGTQAREIVLQGSQVGSGIPVGIGMMRSGGTGSGQVIDGGSYSAIQK